MNFALTRKLIIFGLVLPLAAIIGFVLATPQDRSTFLFIAVVAGVLVLPIMMKWYHPLLILTLNASMNVYFLPGRPDLWMLIAVIGVGIVLLNSTLNSERQMVMVPALIAPLLLLLAVVMLTAKLTGGIGVRALGGGQLGGTAIGGKGYFSIIFGTMAYFVLTSKIIAPDRAKNYVSGYFLSGTTALISNLAYTLGPAFYFLFYLFPVDLAISQAMADYSFSTVMKRINGLAIAGAAGYFFMMSRYGVRGIFTAQHPLRLLIFLGFFVMSLFGGYRSLLITFGVHFLIQFYLEGLLRTRLGAFLLIGGLAASALMFPFVNKMPLPVQRCLAFIPGAPVTQSAKVDAMNSTIWRVEMWQILLGEVPKYLVLGKGYAINAADLYLAGQAERLGLVKGYEVSILAGAYHSGPLSVIIPFGIFGMIGFLWLMSAGLWVLYRNYRYGDPAMRLINTFFFAYFAMRVIVFFFIFGALDSELAKFTAILGLSVAINRGVRKPVQEPVKQVAGLSLQPASP